MRLYLDTHIFVDYWDDRVDKMRPLGEFAHIMLQDAVKCKHFLLISDLVLYELNNSCGITENVIWGQILSDLVRAGKLSKVGIMDKQREEARALAMKMNIPKSDALHAILARDNDAIFVSRDNHHDSVRELVKVMKPEEINNS